MKTVILDNGHGGLIKGKYTTCPNHTSNPKTWKKMHIHYGKPIYEGVFNRKVVDMIAEILFEKEINFHVLVPENKDISLKERVKRINEIVEKEGNDCYLVSIHGNAFNSEAYGYEVFTSRGQNESDLLAEVFFQEMKAMFPDKKMRTDKSDGDSDKEANFYIFKCKCPSVLTENFFFDNPVDARMMMSKEGIEKLAQAHVNAIIKINEL